MVIAVTDANIFIDLINLEMLGYLFDLDLEIHTTYEVYDQLNEDQEKIAQNFVQSNLLKLYSFSFEELEEISNIEFPKGLEIADRTIFYYASKKIEGIILSGDRKLRKFCESHNHDVKGIVWVFDEIHSRSLIDSNFLSYKLEELLKRNSRLPIEECQSRISKWRKE